MPYFMFLSSGSQPIIYLKEKSSSNCKKKSVSKETDFKQKQIIDLLIGF